jgi:hypothetical protein
MILGWRASATGFLEQSEADAKKTISIEAVSHGHVRFMGDRMIVASLGEVVKSYPWRAPICWRPTNPIDPPPDYRFHTR